MRIFITSVLLVSFLISTLTVKAQFKTNAQNLVTNEDSLNAGSNKNKTVI